MTRWLVVFFSSLSLFLLLLAGGVFAQFRSLPPIIQQLHEAKGDIFPVPQSLVSLIPVEDFPFKDTDKIGQFILKHENSIYVCVPGTGRVYQLNIQGKQFSWTRVDSTYFSGYNFGAIFFSMDSTLYSYGGEGFWNMNGDLRYYNPLSNEWDAFRLSESIPTSFHIAVDHWFYFPDPRKKTLTVLGSNRHPGFLKDPKKKAPHKNKLFELDIVSGNWKEKGAMRDTGFSIWGFLPAGMIVSPGDVVDLDNNRYLKPTPSLQRKIHRILFSNPRVNRIDLSFCVDSTLYVGTYSGMIDSLVFSADDFVDTGIPVYIPLQDPGFFSMDKVTAWSLGLFMVGALFLPWMVRKRKNSAALPAEKNNDEQHVAIAPDLPVLQSSRSAAMFTEREASLLAFLHTNSAKGMLTSIEEINGFLGVALKSVEIQKRMRSDLITSINEKFALITGKALPLIDKTRSDFDKRSFDYFIQQACMELVAALLPKP